MAECYNWNKKPTLGQFIDYAARCGYILDSAEKDFGERMVLTFI